jgi:replication factor C large subunit
MLWADKHRPHRLDDVLGHSQATKLLDEWARLWKKGEKQGPILLAGGAGVGKTLLATTLAEEYDFELLEFNASDTRNAANVTKFAGLASSARTFSGKLRLLLLDEIDGLFGTEDRGGSSAVLEIVKENACPLILTANDVWEPKLRSIKNHCQVVELKKVNYLSIASFLGRIANAEKVSVPKEILTRIAAGCGGDIRSAINDLELIAEGRDKVTEADTVLLSKRDRTENMFEVIRTILKTNDFWTARRMASVTDEDPEMLLNWVDENVPREYTDKGDLYRAYENISRADIFLGRIWRRQSYEFMKYANDLMSAGVALSKEHKYSGFTRYSFPSHISSMSRSKGERGLRKSAAGKIAKQCHVSTKTAVQDYLPLFGVLMADKERAARLAAQFEFSEEELEFLGAPSPKATAKEAEAIRAEHIRQSVEVKPEKGQHSLSSFS